MRHNEAKEKYGPVIMSTTGWDGQRYNESTIIEMKRLVLLMGGDLPEEPIYPRGHDYARPSDEDDDSDADDEDQGGEDYNDHHP